MNLIRILTGFLFVVLLVIGLWLASHRSLWNDEIYSLGGILGKSYKTIALGGIPEGNNSPLFYILQKAQCDLFSYQQQEESSFGHFFLRVQPVLFIAVSLSALFYYFARRNSWAWGAYALAVTVTSSLFWDHWTEARPYAIWFSLSLLQILLLLRIFEDSKNSNRNNLCYLIFIHCLLALTSVISAIQIIAAGIVLGFFQRLKYLWHVSLVLIPLAICIFYYLRAPHYDFFFVNGPMELINANIPKDRLLIIFIPAGIFFFQHRDKNWGKYMEMKYLAFLLLMLGAFTILLIKLKYSQSNGQHGFQISSRYFLSLLPAGIVATVLFSEYLTRVFSFRIWKIAAIIILGSLLLFRFERLTLPQFSIDLNLISQKNGVRV